MCSASRLIVLYIFVKFHENIESMFKGMQLQKKVNQSYFFVLCTLSHGALHL